MSLNPTRDLREFVSQVHEQLKEVLKRLSRIERKDRRMADQLAELDQKLDAVAENETKLGQDIKTVIAALKNIPSPPPDLTAQLAKLDKISQDLIDSDADTLANLPPAPPTP